jgi:phosphohistidine phosphatase
MDLILWRHADAEPGGRDLERKLTTKGKKQAKRVAAWLREWLPEDAVVLASPARRAQQTAEALTKSFQTVPELAPDASAQKVLSAAGWPHGAGAVVVVGHQPTLGRAAALALTGAPADWSVKKAAVWWLSFDEQGKETALRAVTSPDFL